MASPGGVQTKAAKVGVADVVSSVRTIMASEVAQRGGDQQQQQQQPDNDDKAVFVVVAKDPKGNKTTTIRNG